MDSSQRLQELFSRYLQRDCQPAEVEELVMLLGQADAEETLSAPMHDLWAELKAHPVEYSVDWGNMYSQVSQVDDDLSALKRRRMALVRRIGWRGIGVGRTGWRVAAAVFLLLAGSLVYWSVSMGRRSGDGRAIAGRAGAESEGVSVQTAAGTRTAAGASGAAVVAGRGQAIEKKRVVHLPDGSTVILNKHSQLDYPVAFASGAREVTLRGEAYFDIVHRPGQPFLVHTGKIVTNVLGTAFNIKAYPGEREIEVTVDHGKVQVLKGRVSLGLLTDNQQIRYDRGTEDFARNTVNLKPVIAWKPVEISFDDITMEEAAREIGQRFNVTVAFMNPVLKDCRVTATFYQEDDLDEIMTVICGVSQSNFVIKGDKIVIDGKGCN
jgi:transmembrane sensor